MKKTYAVTQKAKDKLAAGFKPRPRKGCNCQPMQTGQGKSNKGSDGLTVGMTGE